MNTVLLGAFLSEDKISQAYCRLLVRCPDFGGFKAMLPLYMDDGRVKEVVRAIAKSPEFQSKYVTNQPPALTIDFLYDRLLARPGDASGKAHWVEQLSQSGSDYKWIVDAFLASPEYVTKFGETKIPGNGRSDCSCCGASQCNENASFNPLLTG